MEDEFMTWNEEAETMPKLNSRKIRTAPIVISAAPPARGRHEFCAGGFCIALSLRSLCPVAIRMPVTLMLLAVGFIPGTTFAQPEKETPQVSGAPQGVVDRETADQDSAQQDATGQEAAGQEAEVQQTDPEHTNALANETSPYLLMHAHNPVQWYPWNPTVLEKAKQENKLIFLSIGYSSCHWCHVMERESFLDVEIANFLNENFICIKVDREERPDIDDIYMTSLHIFNTMSGRPGGGGWPLSMFLTPEGLPFFGGTYFPARTGDRGTSTGFLTIIQKIHETWTADKTSIERDAQLISENVRKELAGAEQSTFTEVEDRWCLSAMNVLAQRFDPEFGGAPFSAADKLIPKFPQPSNLMFLQAYATSRPTTVTPVQLLETTLDRMMMGGIYDHLGGGFHRYSVDRFWRIPHFEKMLYDNAQLTTVYARMFEMNGRAEYKTVVEETLAFVDRELTSPEGGFYSALDAESEGEEGKFYRWTREELNAALTPDQLKFFGKYYGTSLPPNFEGQYYALQLAQKLSIHATAEGVSLGQIQDRLRPIREKLFEIRATRTRPLTDTKILTSWNGMMIRGYADAGRILKNPAYIQTAVRAAEFAWNHLRTDDGRLWRTFTAGQAKLNGYLIDYACLTDGLIALHQATGEEVWLNRAMEIQKKQDELFKDEERGGYFFTSNDHEKLLARGKKPTDGALPSGSSVSANNLIYFAANAPEEQSAAYRQQARQTLFSVASMFDRFPIAAPRMLIAVQKLLDLSDKKEGAEPTGENQQTKDGEK